MKSLSFKILILLIFSSSYSSELFAQVQVSKFGFSLSHWNRTYGEVDERFFFINAPSEQGGFTSAALMPAVFAEVNLHKGLALEGRLGVWSYTYTGSSTFANGLVVEESIQQRIIPASLSLIYNIPINEKLSAFAGLGVNRYFLQHTADRNVTTGEGNIAPVEFTGNNYGMNVKLGLEYYFTDNIGLGLEGRYNTGSYNKSYTPDFGGPSVTRNIELSGLEFGVSLRYRLFKMTKITDDTESKD